MSIFGDLRGSLSGGEFYHDILARSWKKGWALYMFLIVICSIALAIHWGVKVGDFAGRAVETFAEIDREIEFENGEIVNMPISHKEYDFMGLMIHVDRKYIDEQSAREDVGVFERPFLFVGPRTSFLVRDDMVQAIDYPAEFTQKVDLEYVENLKSTLVIVAFIGGFIIWLLIKFIESYLYILIIIAPILLFKFRRMGLTYGEGIKTGMYLVAFQLIISTLLLLFNITYMWIHLAFIAFYILFIGGFVNIDLAHSKRQLFHSDESA